MQQVSVPYLNMECGALPSVHPQVKLLFPMWVKRAGHNLFEELLPFLLLYMMSFAIYLASSLLTTKFKLTIWVTETCWIEHRLLGVSHASNHTHHYHPWEANHFPSKGGWSGHCSIPEWSVVLHLDGQAVRELYAYNRSI